MKHKYRFFSVLASIIIMLGILIGCEPPSDISVSKTPVTLKIHFIDVGQADSILIQDGDTSMLIDAGNNADAKTIINYLKKQGVKKLSYVVGTHPHEDHIGALDTVIKTFDVEKILMPNVTSNTNTYRDVLYAIKNKNLKITVPNPGNTFTLGRSEFTVLAPNSAEYEDVNDYSIVMKLNHGSRSFLFTGDAEKVSESEILKKKYNLQADVLKIAHHGSKSSTSDKFLKAVDPKYAVISVGRDNNYGHPTQKTLNRLKVRKVPIYRTDENGTIVITSDGNNINFTIQSDNMPVK